MAKNSGGGGRPGRGGGGGSPQADTESAMGAIMDAAYSQLSKRISAIESEQYKLNKEYNRTNSKRRRREIDERISSLGRKKSELSKQRTKIYESNPLEKRREAERLDYALTR